MRSRPAQRLRAHRLIPLLLLLVASGLTLSATPATVSQQQAAITGLYRNTTEGFSITLPDGWVAQEREDTRPLLSIENAGGFVPGWAYLWILPRADDASAEEWLNRQIDRPTIEEVVVTGPPTYPGADSVHQVKFVLEAEDGSKQDEQWTAAARGSQMFLLRVSTLQTAWGIVEAKANAFTNSFSLETPMPFGASRDDSLFQYWGEIVSIDPALARGSPQDIVGGIFSGLVKLDTNLQVVPDIAESWDVSPDGTVFTFTLRESARFHDGRTVTAADFKYSWERALSPTTESPTGETYLNDIVGARAMLDGEASELAGVEVLGARTLRVTIEAPYPYFTFKLIYPTAYVVDRANVESGGENWTDAPNGTGPYKLKAWEKDRLLVLERNDDWYGGMPALANFVYRIFAGAPMQMYENGEIDLVHLSTYDIDRALDPSSALHSQLHTATAFCTSYIGFNVEKPPFNDPKVRQALALAYDVSKTVEVSFRSFHQRAAGIIPPGMPGHNATIAPYSFDVDAARRLLDESSYQGDLPPIVSYASDSAAHWSWETYLGAEVEAVSVFDFADWLMRSDNGEFGVFGSGWCADYPDPQNFLDILFHTDGGENGFAYSNPQVDALLEEAATERNATRRISLYRQAEQLILDDWVIIPLWHSRDYQLVRPYVKGYEVTPIGVPQYQNVRIER